MNEAALEAAKRYLHTVYCIEQMGNEGFYGVYGLEQQRIHEHENLCDIMRCDHEETKEITLWLDKTIGFDIQKLDDDYEYWLDKYAIKLVEALGKLPLQRQEAQP